MSTIRVMPGIADQESRLVNTLRVGEMVSRLPLPRYRVTCERCGSQTTESHERLNSGAAHCRAAGCGKTVPSRRDRLEDERRAAAEREAQRAADELDISARRMAAETDDYELPERFAPKPSEHTPMTERERQSLREFKEQQEAEQRAADAPRLEAERKASIEQAERDRHESERKERQRAYWAEAVSTGPDPQFAIDPATTTPIPNSQVDAYHKAEMAKFTAKNPSYYRCPENETAVMGYLQRNAPGLKLLSAVQLEQAVNRLSALGLLRERPAPALPSAPASKRTVAQPPVKPTGPKTYGGRDYMTGLERQYTEREIDRMSSDEFKRAFHVASTIGELFAAIGDSRQ